MVASSFAARGETDQPVALVCHEHGAIDGLGGQASAPLRGAFWDREGVEDFVGHMAAVTGLPTLDVDATDLVRIGWLRGSHVDHRGGS